MRLKEKQDFKKAVSTAKKVGEKTVTVKPPPSEANRPSNFEEASKEWLEEQAKRLNQDITALKQRQDHLRRRIGLTLQGAESSLFTPEFTENIRQLNSLRDQQDEIARILRIKFKR